MAAAAILIAQAVTWVAVSVPHTTGGSQRVVLHGHDIEPALAPVGWALLALTVAQVAGHGPIRRLVGVVMVLVGAAGVAVAFAARRDTGPTVLHHTFAPAVSGMHPAPNAWWVVAAVGGLLAVLTGAYVAVASGGWERLSAKYDAPAGDAAPPEPSAGVGAPAEDDTVTWKALDRGEDPTA